MPSLRLTRRALVAALPGSALVAAGLPTAAALARETATPVATPARPDSVVAAGATAAYTLDVRLDTETNLLSGTEAIVWRNTTGHDQDTLHLRLYPNAAYYGDAAVTLHAVAVDAVPTTATLRPTDPTVASVPLGRVVPPDGDVRLDLAFETRVPAGVGGSFGIFGLDMARGSWALADWYPILAGWEPERGDWYLDPPTAFGDPTFAETATYALSLDAPAALALIATGSLVDETPGPPDQAIPTVIRQVTTGPVREFAMALLPRTNDTDGDLRRYPAVSPGATPLATPGATPLASPEASPMPPGTHDPVVSLALYAPEDVPDLGDTIVGTATTALPHYRDLLGPLSIDALAIASAHLAGANGVSWPGMIWLDLTILARDGALGAEEVPGLRFTVVHEVGHQWIGGVLGPNSNDHGFLLEGLTNALAIGVIRDAFGADAAVEAMGRFVAGPYSGLVRDDRDLIADAPLTNETNVVLRALVVYGKAGLGFEAIRQVMGNDAWRAALGAFAETFRQRVFTPADLRTALQAAAPAGTDIAALWAFWFDQATVTLADIDPIVQGAGH